MAEHPIQGLMNVTMDKIRQMADSNTIIGKPIKTDDGTTILPVSRICSCRRSRCLRKQSRTRCGTPAGWWCRRRS